MARLRRPGKGRKGAQINTGQAFWGFMLERGTRYIAAKPWFLPAIRSIFPVWVDALATELREELKTELEKFISNE